MAIEELYGYNESDAGELSNGKPPWFKLWGEKYADALDVDNLDDDLTPQEKEKLFNEVGKAFINALLYFRSIDNGESTYSSYKAGTRDGRIVWNALKRDIDQSYRDYYKRVENGKKGGRPRKNNTEEYDDDLPWKQ